MHGHNVRPEADIVPGEENAVVDDERLQMSSSEDPGDDRTGRSAPSDPVETWRRAIVVTLRDVTAQLARSIDDAPRVHALRRGGKLLRALALLAPDNLDTLADETRDHADILRRSLGQSRDAAVRRETFDALAREMDEAGFHLRAILETPAAEVDGAALPDTLRETFAALAERWAACDLRDVHTDALVATLASTYRRARKRRKAVRSGDVRDLHRWRRTIVDLDLQTGIFADHSPHLARISRRAHKLRDLLGRTHDIEALSDFLAQSGIDHPDALASFDKAASRERQRLTQNVKTLGARLLKSKTGAWKDEVAARLYAATRTAEAAAPPRNQPASV